MTPNPKTIPARLKKAIKRHTKAQINLSWMGGGCPEDIPYYEEDARLAEECLKKILAELGQILGDAK
jgi:hypothetical protein